MAAFVLTLRASCFASRCDRLCCSIPSPSFSQNESTQCGNSSVAPTLRDQCLLISQELTTLFPLAVLEFRKVHVFRNPPFRFKRVTCPPTSVSDAASLTVPIYCEDIYPSQHISVPHPSTNSKVIEIFIYNLRLCGRTMVALWVEVCRTQLLPTQCGGLFHNQGQTLMW